MSRLQALFGRNRKVLVAYLCVGDPSVEETLAFARSCVRAGADVLELGVPFSDPSADGPAIARASQRAIASGGGFEAALRVAKAIRAEMPGVGLVLFGYYNPLFVRGERRAVQEAASAGIDALLIVDLPLDESGSLRATARDHGLDVVPLLAPTSGTERAAAVAELQQREPLPFVYYVSVTGVTGSGAIDPEEAGARARRVRELTGCPVVVGFGIDSREKARSAAAKADGVVVGTALIREIERGATANERCEAVERLVRELRAGIDEG